jgi:hypothetical protein
MLRTASRTFEAAQQLGSLWCSLAHTGTMWPIHGEYRCRTCGRRYRVAWADPELSAAAPTRAGARRSFGAVLLPLLLVAAAAFPSSVRGAGALMLSPGSGPALAFARYTASQPQSNTWRSETIEIDASLPKLAKQGRFRAIRRLLPFGRPQYQVLELEGDQTVKQQVIERYLSTDARAAEIPASSVAVTPANYKFHYKGTAATASGAAYVFQIAPRHKREGLIKGELWLDSESGMAVRQSGYLVKKPSLFVKRVDVTRELSMTGGVVEARVTHLLLDLRLVGRADVVIQERPLPDAAVTPSPSLDSSR